MQINSTNFYLLEQEKLTALFVNSEESPIEYKALDHYQVKLENHKYEFCRLYELTYLLENQIKCNVLKFLEVKVKPQYQEVLYCHIKLMEGCKEFVL